MFNFFFKSCRLSDNVQKYSRVEQATDGIVDHAHCMVDSEGYRQVLRIYNTYCFSTATVFARMRLNGTLIRKLHVLFSFYSCF